MGLQGAKFDPIAGTPVGPGVPWLALARAALLLVGLLGAGLLLRALPGVDHAAFASGVLRRGLGGRIVFLGLGTLVCAVGLPRQAVGFAGGFAYGPIAGTLLATVANLAACAADLLWARLVARDWARRRLLRGRLARLDGFVSANPFVAILTLRLLPVGSSLMLSLLAGVLDVRLAPFLGATLLGSLPQTVIFALLGGGARIGQTAQIALGIALFLAASGFGVVLLRRFVASAAAAPGSSAKT